MANRLYSIDSLRAVAIFFVVIAHVTPFLGFDSYGTTVFFLLDTIGQFDVPFFFVASGYFFAKSVDPDTVREYAKYSVRKLSSLYSFGIIFALTISALLAVVHGQPVWNTVFAQPIGQSSLLELFYYGDSIAIHLWFLLGLLYSLCFVSAFVAIGKQRYVLFVATLIHCVGIISRNYPMVFDIGLQTQDALFFGFFYVALGFHLRKSDFSPTVANRRRYLGGICVFLLLQLLEQYLIAYHANGLVFGQEIYFTEFTMSTAPLVFFIFAFALATPELGKGTILPRLGTHAGGVYLVHLPVYHAVQAVQTGLVPIIGIELSSTVLYQLLIAPVVYGLSLVVYLGLVNGRVIDPDGSHIPFVALLRSRLRSRRSSGEPAAD
ncbi:acyltransferase [Halocatena halophila]|uniref:acyltransferase n=1 Tax=Halocatena halophila TaxID=2814576 RepID=UPI002ED43FF3